MDKHKILGTIFVSLSALYVVWHLGRAYEHQIVKNLVRENLSAVYVYELPSLKNPQQVNCILDSKVDRVFQYTGLDY